MDSFEIIFVHPICFQLYQLLVLLAFHPLQATSLNLTAVRVIVSSWEVNSFGFILLEY
jgi:hypothetical protein